LNKLETILGFRKYTSNAVVKIIIIKTKTIASNHPWIYPIIERGIAEIHIPKIGINEAKNTISAIVRRYGKPQYIRPIR
jgi:hypothetical protein